MSPSSLAQSTMSTSDCDWECTSNTSATSKGDEAFARKKAGLQKVISFSLICFVQFFFLALYHDDFDSCQGELNCQLIEYINEWRKTRQKEEEELKMLKDKQAQRKQIRAEQEKILGQQKKEDEDRLRKEEIDKKAEEANEKKKRLEEAEAKRQQMLESQKTKGGRKTSAAVASMSEARREITKNREQLEEERELALAIRIKPLDLEVMDSEDLKAKATELFNTVVQLETDRYDYEQRAVAQEYELKELKERQKIQLRQKAVKKGMDPEALAGRHPPMIRMYSKYERRTDTRTYDDRKKLYEGGWEVIRAETLETMWTEKYEEWGKRPAKKLPRWFGERLGRRGGQETAEGEEQEQEEEGEEYEGEEEEAEDEEEEEYYEEESEYEE